jgi:hypothetical protein
MLANIVVDAYVSDYHNVRLFHYSQYIMWLRLQTVYGLIVLMAKTKQKRKISKSRAQTQELDSVFMLKLVLYLIIGAQWIRFENHDGVTQIPIPIGLIIGMLFAAHDHFKIDRRIEFAVLLIAMFVGFWTQVGVYITY